LWNIIEYLRKSITPEQLSENTQLVNNLASFCSSLVDQVELQTFPSGKFKAFKFVMWYLRCLTTSKPAGSPPLQHMCVNESRAG